MRNNIALVHVHDNKHEDDINLLAKMLSSELSYSIWENNTP